MRLIKMPITPPTLTTLELSLENHVARVCLDRPAKANAMSRELWTELRIAFGWIDATPEARVAIIGGGMDLICCADMRYCSADAFFSIKEIDMGMTADVGTLQRLPRLIGDGMTRELAYTGRQLAADEAKAVGLVNRVFESPEALQAGVMQIAAGIAAKSPLAIRGTKEMIVYARDHPVADSLNYIATWNAAMLMSADLQEAMRASMQKGKAKFRN